MNYKKINKPGIKRFPTEYPAVPAMQYPPLPTA